jgi:hypothetical protein
MGVAAIGFAQETPFSAATRCALRGGVAALER